MNTKNTTMSNTDHSSNNQSKERVCLKFSDSISAWTTSQVLKSLLGTRFDIDETEPSDYYIYTMWDKDKKAPEESVNIYYTGENDVPDFNTTDYAISFHRLTFDDRHLRCPIWVFHNYNDLDILENKTITPDLAERKFCNFLYSNKCCAHPFRNKFFQELSKYKNVDSGGQMLNNIGGRVENKREFISQYKFTIAMENSPVKGYTTEKLIDSMVGNSIPIYWGDEAVELDFNTKSFIWIKDESQIKQAIEEIIYLDNDHQAYLNKLREPWFVSTNIKELWDKQLVDFFDHILTQPKHKAKRTTQYGATEFLQATANVVKLVNQIMPLRKVLYKIVHLQRRR